MHLSVSDLWQLRVVFLCYAVGLVHWCERVLFPGRSLHLAFSNVFWSVSSLFNSWRWVRMICHLAHLKASLYCHRIVEAALSVWIVQCGSTALNSLHVVIHSVRLANGV